MRFSWSESRDAAVTCHRAVELVTAYLDGALSADDQTRFETHLVYCPPCVEHLKQVRATIQATGRLHIDDLDPQVRTDLMDLYRRWRADGTA
jgi:anti-sigma factor RsiW